MENNVIRDSKRKDTVGHHNQASKPKLETNGDAESNKGNCLMWFRSDLRIKDNRALESASISSNTNLLMGLFVCSPDEWNSHSMSPFKVDFISRNLKELKEALDKLNIPILILKSDTQKDVPKKVLEICQKYSIKNIFLNIEYEVDERNRDITLKKLAEKNDIHVNMFHDQCIVTPGVLKTNEQKAYTVFTPYKNKWFKQIGSDKNCLRLSETPRKLDNNIRKKYENLFDHPQLDIREKFELEKEKKEKCTQLFPAGETEAQKRLDNFIDNRINKYKEYRDYPGLDGTSALSMYLSVGIISARQCVCEVQKKCKKNLGDGSGPLTWITEICWRDFYRHILFVFPHVCKNKPFKREAENIKWNNDDELFKAWCDGKTGYPIVDAGMRQLNSTGWMHNRLRMITATFLSKTLLINWQKGEDYFMRNLVDGDFASNNGGWQWCASTGTDSQPYFRIFNPITQSQKFDKNGLFIKKWIPELKDLNEKEIHDPFAKNKNPDLSYPKHIVDYSENRKAALKIFELALKKKK